MSVTTSIKKSSLRIVALALQEPWTGFVIGLSGFPAPEHELELAREFLNRMVPLLAKRSGGAPETFLQFTQLHLGDGAQRLSSRGAAWLPSMGLGVWPDREPPHSWTLEEMRDLVPTDKVRPLMDIALRIGAPEKAEEVRGIMLGLGTVLQCILPTGSKGFLEAARKLLLPPITDPCFTAFPFYVPLLEGKSVAGASASVLDTWSCGAGAYVRESPEDQGILVLVRGPIDDLLLQSGAIKESRNHEWRVPGDDASA